jgi:hypothetical protein
VEAKKANPEANTTVSEAEIDNHASKLYNLTKEEIKKMYLMYVDESGDHGLDNIQPDFPRGEYNPNASLYDIREHFQGRNAKGRMNSRSDDVKYTELIRDLRDKLKILAKKIEPKVYEYGFLKR